MRYILNVQTDNRLGLEGKTTKASLQDVRDSSQLQVPKSGWDESQNPQSIWLQKPSEPRHALGASRAPNCARRCYPSGGLRLCARCCAEYWE